MYALKKSEEPTDVISNCTMNYDQFAETFYSNQDLENYIRIVRSQIKQHLDNDARFRVKKYVKRNDETESETNKEVAEKMSESQSQEENQSLVCRLKKASLKANTNGLDYRWQNPPKIIFKPFVEVINFRNNLFK